MLWPCCCDSQQQRLLHCAGPGTRCCAGRRDERDAGHLPILDMCAAARQLAGVQPQHSLSPLRTKPHAGGQRRRCRLN
eukprot:364268-Chlamydomonas_euryale.AAC.4